MILSLQQTKTVMNLQCRNVMITVSVVLDTGISETTVIDGKTYVVVKNASDFVKAVKSIATVTAELNVYIADNINLTAED